MPKRTLLEVWKNENDTAEVSVNCNNKEEFLFLLGVLTEQYAVGAKYIEDCNNALEAFALMRAIFEETMDMLLKKKLS